MKKRIAIIGAGMSGLTLANRLKDVFDVVIFEKSRGVGGRMATRTADAFKFDHGTQFFTVREKRFSHFISDYINSGIVSEWKGKVITLEADKKTSTRLWFEPHYVACPGMNSLCKKMAEGISIRINCEVVPLAKRNNNVWQLTDISNQELGEFDIVISTAPPIQTSKLFHDFLPLSAPLRNAKFLACFTMMFGFHKTWDKSWIAAKVKNSPIEWIAVNSSKPGRDTTKTTLVVNSSNIWAEEHVNDDLTNTEKFLRNELNRVLDVELEYPDYFSLHRWRYALVSKPQDKMTRDLPHYDESLNLASVGDWGSQSRIEDVWIQANQLADTILA